VGQYTGFDCSFSIDNCKNIVCHYGTCETISGVSRCKCIAGYTGETCDTQINYCESEPCMNGGECIRLLNKYVCSCAAGYTGTNCDVVINPCSDNSCLNNGLCIQIPNTFDFRYIFIQNNYFRVYSMYETGRNC
jgi:hypothetical protein